MSYKIPNSVIYLLSNIPFHSDYKDTLHSSSRENQYQDFSTYITASLTQSQYSYVREKDAIRIAIPHDELVHINYMIYKNTEYSSKYFYAFVTKTEYVNNETSLLYFEIDVIQTWIHDITFLRSYVERETTPTDNYGEHTLIEPINSTDHIELAEQFLDLSWNYSAAEIYTTYELAQDYPAVVVTQRDHMLYGYNRYLVTDVGVLKTMLQQMTTEGKMDGVIGIRMVPLLPSSFENYSVHKPSSSDNDNPYRNFNYRNKKCYSYPYCYLNIYTPEGYSSDFKYEYFTQNNCTFTVSQSNEIEPTVGIVPTNYKESGNNSYDHVIYVNNFPQVTFSVDKLLDYIGQNKVSLTLNTMFSALQIASGYGTANAGAMLNGGSNIVGTLGHIADLANQAPTLKGSTQTDLPFVKGYKGVYFKHMVLKPEVMSVIDDYFDRYGYRVDTIKVPTFMNRRYWTYIKLRELNAIARIPEEDYIKIKNILINGITFWANIISVGHYEYPNSTL